MRRAGLESPVRRVDQATGRTAASGPSPRGSSAPTYFEPRDRALLAHATQVDPDGTWFTVPLDMQREVWPTEDYEAALSYVPDRPGEDDLFAGLGSAEEAADARDQLRASPIALDDPHGVTQP